MFRKVKNVNVESLKKRSKLLDFQERGGDESRHLLLPFPVLRSLRLLRSSRSLRSLQTLRTIRSIRSIRVQKQNVGFVFRLVYSFANARCVGV